MRSQIRAMSASDPISWDTAFFAPIIGEEDGTKVAPEDPAVEKAPAAKKHACIKKFDLQLSFWLENTKDKKHESAVYFWRNFWNVVDDVAETTYQRVARRPHCSATWSCASCPG